MRRTLPGVSLMLGAILLAPAGCSRSDDRGVPQDDQTGVAPAPSADASDPERDSGASEPSADLEAQLAIGAEAFVKAQCATCHGPDGKGARYGPNLTDKTWIHCDGSVEGIHDVIMHGIPREDIKNPKFKMKMSPVTKYITDEDTIHALAQYVHSLSHPAGD